MQFSSPIGDLFILIGNAVSPWQILIMEFSSPIGDLFILIIDILEKEEIIT